MNTTLRIGNLLFDGEQVFSVLSGYGLLEPFIRGVVIDTAIQEIVLSKEELLMAIPGSHGLISDADLSAYLIQWCTANQIDLTRLQWDYIRPARIEKFKQLVFAPRVEDEFQQRNLDLSRVEYSLIRVQDAALAHELFLMLRDDQFEFEQLAQRYSQGQEREAGGYMGVFAFSQVPTQFLDVFRICAPRQIWSPILIEDWSYILRLERITPAALTDTMRSQLLDQLFAEWLQAQVTTLLSTPNAVTLCSEATAFQTMPNSSAVLDTPESSLA